MDVWVGDVRLDLRAGSEPVRFGDRTLDWIETKYPAHWRFADGGQIYRW